MKSKLVTVAVAATLSFGGVAAAVSSPSFAAVVGVSASQTASYPVLQKGAQGQGVKVLQRLLNADGAKLAVDGSFGNRTLDAVKAFQKKKGLAVDGSVGPATWSKLVPVVKYGDRGAHVAALQQSLGALEADGSFGPATKKAVLALQEAKGLQRDGVAGPATWGALVGAATTPKPDPEPTETTKPGKRRFVVMNQMKTGTFGGENCGPTSAMMAMVAYGVKPDYYGGPTQYADAVHHFRRDAHRMNNQWVGVGSSGDQIRKGLSSYKVPNRRTDVEDALKAVRSGKMVISHGHSSRLPWTRGGGGHYILIGEYLGNDQYRVLDPAGGHDKVATGAQLRWFASKNQPEGNRADRHYNQTVVG